MTLLNPAPGEPSIADRLSDAGKEAVKGIAANAILLPVLGWLCITAYGQGALLSSINSIVAGHSQTFVDLKQERADAKKALEDTTKETGKTNEALGKLASSVDTFESNAQIRRLNRDDQIKTMHDWIQGLYDKLQGLVLKMDELDKRLSIEEAIRPHGGH